jgi:hypothetical protein
MNTEAFAALLVQMGKLPSLVVLIPRILAK